MGQGSQDREVRDLTPKEEKVLDALGQVWNLYTLLPRSFEEGGHHDDQADFRYHIHRLQDLVACRPTYRGMRQAGPAETESTTTIVSSQRKAVHSCLP